MANDGKKLGSGGFKSGRGSRFGTLEQVFDDIWWAWGTTKMAPGILFPRNMAIVREANGDLVVIHPVMMPEVEQTKIEALGPIKHVVRLGAFHGMDDLLYVEKYKAQLWAPPGIDLAPGLTLDHELRADSIPIAGATLFDFEASRSIETLLHLPRHGGVLFSCDSIQNWETKTGCTWLAGVMAGMMGFKGRACIGPGWRKQCEPKDGVGFGPAFEKVLALDFEHALGAHGAPMKGTAKADLRASVTKLYPNAKA